MTLIRFVFLLLALAAPAAAQQLPQLPRTIEPLAVTFIDGAVKMDRHLYRATALPLSIAYALQGAPPVVTVLGVGVIGFTVDVPTVADANAQVYRAYVGNKPAIALAAICVGSERPFQCSAPIDVLKPVLTATPQPLSLTALVAAADGEVESARGAAPFVLRLAGPPVGPTPAATSIRPR
jgi:hypothetical protein